MASVLTRCLTGALAAACAVAGIALASPTLSVPLRRQDATFNNEVVFVPPSDYTSHKVLYARSAQLPDGSLILTWDNQSPEPPEVWTPVFRSTDGGYTWSNYTTIHDSQNGWGLRYQAFPFVLTEQIGRFPEGSVLLAVNSAPANWSDFKIELYASTDNAQTFTFVSHIAPGRVGGL